MYLSAPPDATEDRRGPLPRLVPQLGEKANQMSGREPSGLAVVRKSQGWAWVSLTGPVGPGTAASVSAVG